VLGSELVRQLAAARSRERLARTIVVFLYLAVVVSTPFFHHDFACHQRTPGHCQACRANPPAPWSAQTVTVVAVPLLDLGGIESASQGAVAWHVPIASSGRSPPA
jgi:hypothetical protein